MIKMNEFADDKPVRQDCPSAVEAVLQTSHTHNQKKEQHTHNFIRIL